MKSRILIVDEETTSREYVRDALIREKMYSVETAENGEIALNRVAENDYALVIIGLTFPGDTGLQVVHGIKEKRPDTEIIVCTDWPTEESMLQALHEHVYDYLYKPLDIHVLRRAVSRSIERRGLVIENRELIHHLTNERDNLRHEVSAAKQVFVCQIPKTRRLVGNSSALANVSRFIAEVAPSDMTVLIRGESGTGKDIVACLIHEFSGRDPNAFSKINCPAIPESLIESELFGYEIGAFTDAVRSKPGRLEMAPNGSVFLDEIGEVSTNIQAKLLQVIEHRKFTRLGGTKDVNISARIIAATNAPLEKMIQKHKFRADLLFRLDQYSIVIPPLREHKEDIACLVEHFLAKYGPINGHKKLSLTPSLLSELCDYDWPGNVRELESVISRFALTADPIVIEEFLEKKNSIPSENIHQRFPEESHEKTSPSKLTLHEREKEMVVAALHQAKWNQKKAAAILGISYSSLRRRVTKYNLKNQPNGMDILSHSS